MVYIVPMREGNSIELSYVGTKPNVYIVPMREGNKGDWVFDEEKANRVYIVPMREGNGLGTIKKLEDLVGLYRPYEGGKRIIECYCFSPCHIVYIVPMREGNENYTYHTYEVRSVYIVPMREGNKLE